MAENQPKAERDFRAFLKELAAEVAEADHIQITLRRTGEPSPTSRASKGLHAPAINPVCHPRIDLTAHFHHHEPDPPDKQETAQQRKDAI